jgi:nitroimidazol reductase NimA-like FMN-containing flavoprotein (pyridoxamine 5'-phosphate oxidase superfamily)
MLIQEITREESIGLLTRRSFGHLACSQNSQPYVTPMHFAHDGDWLYSFSTVGHKIAWMRTNPLVCLEAKEIEGPQKWTTVIVLGRYEELPETPEFDKRRKFAYALLQQRRQWWEPGYANTILHGAERKMELVYFRIGMVQISGHRATP